MVTERPRQLFRGSVALLIEDSRSNLLMVQQASPEKGFGWSLPAGGIESNEDPLTAVYREAEEELGVRIKITNFFKIYSLEREGRTSEAFAFVFWANHIPLEILRLPAQEILAAKYISYREIVAMDRKGELYKPLYNRQIIKDWRSHPQRFSLGVLSPFIPLSKQTPLI